MPSPSTPTTIFHVTPAANLPSIQTKGLLPMIGERSKAADEMFSAVYLFSSVQALEDACMNWLPEQFDEDTPVALLAINLPEPLRPTPGCEWETVSTQPIAPASITTISSDLFAERMQLCLDQEQEGDAMGPAP